MASINDLHSGTVKRLIQYKENWKKAKERGDEKDANRWHMNANALRKANNLEGNNFTSEQLTDMLNDRNKPQVSTSERTFTQSSSSPQFDYMAEIKRMAELQKQARIAGLTKSRDASLSRLGSEKSTIQPEYYNARNDASTQSKMNARNFAEYYAQNGLNKSGENTQARIANSVALQRNIGNLKQSEAEAFADIARRESDVHNAYNSDVASANAGVEASKMQALINQANADRAYNLQRDDQLFNQGHANKMYDMQYEGQKFNQGISEAGLTGYYNGQQTMQGQSHQAQMEATNIINSINQLKLDNLPAQLKGELALIEQQLAAGDISIDTAKYNYNQLIDPDSHLNKMKDAEYRSTLADIAHKHKLTSNIGADNRSPEQKKLDQYQLEEYEKNMNEPAEVTADVKISEIVSSFRGMSPEQAVTELKNFASDYIRDLGMNDYNKLLAMFENQLD